MIDKNYEDIEPILFDVVAEIRSLKEEVTKLKTEIHQLKRGSVKHG